MYWRECQLVAGLPLYEQNILLIMMIIIITLLTVVIEPFHFLYDVYIKWGSLG